MTESSPTGGLAAWVHSDKVHDELDALQEIVFNSITSQFRSPVTGSSDTEAPVVIGFDTNVLKFLRRDVTKVAQLAEHARAGRLHLVLPGQAVTEFWNNYDVFTKEDVQTAISSAQKLEKIDIPGVAEKASEIIGILNRVGSSADDSAASAYSRASQVIENFENNALIPRANRHLFHTLAEARLSAKVPPGFKDASKTSPAGDFYIWIEFLMGSLAWKRLMGFATVQPVLVTGDTKADWRTAGDIHPVLQMEARAVLGDPVELWSFKDLNDAVKDLYPNPDLEED